MKSRSANLLEATVAAIPVWTLAWLAGAIAMLAPLSRWRGFGRASGADGKRDSLRALAIGAALMGAAILLRVATASAYAALAQRLTA